MARHNRDEWTKGGGRAKVWMS